MPHDKGKPTTMPNDEGEPTTMPYDEGKPTTMPNDVVGNTTIKWYTNWGRDGDGDEDGDGKDDDDDDDDDDEGGGVVGGRGTMTCEVGNDNGATQQSNQLLHTSPVPNPTETAPMGRRPQQVVRMGGARALPPRLCRHHPGGGHPRRPPPPA